MHDATIDMRDTTKHLDTVSTEMRGTMDKVVDTSTEMKTIMTTKMDAVVKVSDKLLESTTELKDTSVKKMDQLSASMGELYDASRQGGSLTARREGLKALLAARQLDKKVAEAGKYFDSFEFQLFSGLAQDLTEEKRLSLYRDATAEFMRDVKEFDDESVSADPFAVPGVSSDNYEKSNRISSFNALAVTAHILNRKQEEFVAKNPGQKTVSMLSLLKSSIEMEKSINEGSVSYSQIPEYAKNVLASRETAVKLIQSRHQFLSLIVLTMVSDLKTPAKSWWDFSNYPTIKGAKMMIWGWAPSLEKLNLVQLKELSQYLDFIIDAQDFLNKNEIQPEVEPKLQRMYSNMKLESTVETKVSSVSAAMSTEKQNVMKKFQLLKSRNQKMEENQE